MKVTVYCQNVACGAHKDLDLAGLRDRFGPDAPAMADDLIPYLRCTACGGERGKLVRLIYAPDSNKVSGMGENLYQKAKEGR